jgi:hypothetical protein
MRRSILALLLVPSIALAQATSPTAAQVFGDGHAVQYHNTELDHRFGRSQIALALDKGTDDPSCTPLITGMLAMLADAAPTLHKRDENFTVSPPLVRALQTQLTVPGFPANVFLAAMVRRVYLERKLPPGWLSTAKKLDPTGTQIDLAKLRFLDDGLHPIDSMYFTFKYLLDRYDVEVKRANSAVAANAMQTFRETYLDHMIAWDGLTLLDVTREEPDKSDKDDALAGDAQPTLIAHLEVRPEDPYKNQPLAAWFHKKKPKPWRFTAKLKPEQYVDLARLPKRSKVIVRGRLFDFDDRLSHFEIRDALLFEDRSNAPAVFATRQQIAKCPMAIDEINGISPRQPGGFGQH